MSQVVMAALDANDIKAKAFQGANDLLARHALKPCHADTLTR